MTTQQRLRPLRHLHPQIHRGGPASRSSTPSMPSAKRPRPISPASSTKAGSCLPDRYDDGGFTGGNMERPALQRLLADIEAGTDRLRRRLQGRSPQPLAARLRQDDGDLRQAPGRLRVGDPAVQHRHVHGPADAQRAACPSPSSNARSSPNAPATRSPPPAARANGPAACPFWATTSMPRPPS